MSSRGAVWYKREPRAFLEGVRKLSERDIAVYAVVLDLIYDAGHQTYDDPKHIASYFSDLGSAGVRHSIDRLVEMGKLIRDGDYLTNRRAQNEGKTREELTETRKKLGQLGGISSAKSRSNYSDISELDEANASRSLSLDKSREDKEKEEPNGSLSETAVSDPPKSSRKRIAYPDDFEAAWQAFPTTPNMSKAEALPEWQKLTQDERATVLPSISGYRAFLKANPDHPPIHFCRYLSKRRFEGFAAAPGVGPVDWSKRLAYARQHGKWSTEEWGPAPGVAGCLVPPGLIDPADGVGWEEWARRSLVA